MERLFVPSISRCTSSSRIIATSIGANLGLSAEAYRNAGGFQHLIAHEDVQLVADLERIGAHIVWTATNPVITSARRDYKCSGGFGDYLASLMLLNTHLGAEPSISPDSSLGAG